MKNVSKLILLLLIFTGFTATAQRTITGVVAASSDGLYIPGAFVKVLPSNRTTTTDAKGNFSINLNEKDVKFTVSYVGFETKTIKLTSKNHYTIELVPDTKALDEVVVIGYGTTVKHKLVGNAVPMPSIAYSKQPLPQSTENYNTINETGFRKADKDPLSTFSIDVDVAAYSNIRRFINNGGLPPKDAVRIEEMINYFDYNYPQPKDEQPVNIVTEIAPAPWNEQHNLIHIGLQAKKISTENLPASNLVFLIDVSGSMNAANKLPLLVSSLKLLADQLRDKDKVAIVVYAGSSGVVLPATSGENKTAIKDALNKLSAGGSTAGGAGLELAYKVATENFIKGGNNRIILATDGDFNVGQSSDSEMQRLIEEKRKSGVFLTVLGYGMGNYKDSKMETLADKGNGNYAYIDNITEAKKVLVNEFGGTLFTVAKDVKFQLEFNPAKVQAYRLIGYENRMLNSEDFNDDKKDAGEIGAGHSVTAIYEIIPVGVKSSFVGSVDDLKYQKNDKKVTAANSQDLLTIKLRYKEPDGNKSKLIEKAVSANSLQNKTAMSDNFKFATAVAEFGMLLRQSEYQQNSSFDQVIKLAESSLSNDKDGYRSEFVRLAKATQLMAKDLRSFANKNGVE
ncbi:MAG: DUF3520 domain-containing protein [Chitinophagaceae bacterium]|nr:MAG: DUF3520 domain-containing protein [Chitinophagaceae bacterium]